MHSEYSQKMEKLGGVYLKDVLGVEEWAFRRDDALNLLDDWLKSGIACKGGDVVVKNKEGRFSYVGRNWYCEKSDFISNNEYLEGSIAKAQQYINTFPEDEKGTYYYVLV